MTIARYLILAFVLAALLLAAFVAASRGDADWWEGEA
jgi:hypothetical protein